MPQPGLLSDLRLFNYNNIKNAFYYYIFILCLQLIKSHVGLSL